jgi:membrane-bound inhibitor of C-type lysozyme
MRHVKAAWNCSILGIAVAPVFAAALLAAAASAQQPSPSPIPAPSQPAPQSPNAPTEPVPSTAHPAAASPSSHMMRTFRRLNYTCDGGAKIVVTLHGSLAKVVYKGHTFNLKKSGEADSHDYSDGSVTWSEKDDIGSLKQGQNKTLASACHLQSAGTAPPNPANTSPSGTTPANQPGKNP